MTWIYQIRKRQGNLKFSEGSSRLKDYSRTLFIETRHKTALSDWKNNGAQDKGAQGIPNNP